MIFFSMLVPRSLRDLLRVIPFAPQVAGLIGVQVAPEFLVLAFEVRASRPFADFISLEKTYNFAAQFAPDLLQQSLEQADTARRVYEASAEVKRGGDRKSEEYKSNADSALDLQPARAAANGVHRDTQRKLDRLAKDRPDLLERVQTGELSVHRAAMEAGIVKPESGLTALNRAWKKASAEERAAFMRDAGLVFLVQRFYCRAETRETRGLKSSPAASASLSAWRLRMNSRRWGSAGAGLKRRVRIFRLIHRN